MNLSLRTALVRPPGPEFASGLTTQPPAAHDLREALRQHQAYVDALREAGLHVEVMEPLQGHPDAWFVEDVAVLVPQGVVLTRPGAPSRRGEVESVQAALKGLPLIGRIEAPATLDGGDVLVAEKRVFIGLSARTNGQGVRQLSDLLEPMGYQCCQIEVGPGLHLKSDLNWIGPETMLTTSRFADHPSLQDFRLMVVDDDESYAANALPVNDRLLLARGFPKTRRQLKSQGFNVTEVETGEARKMDGGLTCLSLRW
ncbi:MAG TPA: arginine deiminase family protein [Acidobacteriota bacterium]|nr:arginine deiminase family protein [Acidobacteriota bacterium]